MKFFIYFYFTYHGTIIHVLQNYSVIHPVVLLFLYCNSFEYRSSGTHVCIKHQRCSSLHLFSITNRLIHVTNLARIESYKVSGIQVVVSCTTSHECGTCTNRAVVSMNVQLTLNYSPPLNRAVVSMTILANSCWYNTASLDRRCICSNPVAILWSRVCGVFCSTQLFFSRLFFS